MGRSKQNVTFEPYPKHVKFAEIWLDYDKKLTMEEISKKVGVSRKTIWTWFKDKEFVGWINSYKDKLLSKSLMARYKTAIRKAEAGDFQCLKLLFEMEGEYVQRTESKNINIDTDFEELTDQKLIKEFEKDLNRYKAITAREDKPGRNKQKAQAAKKD